MGLVQEITESEKDKSNIIIYPFPKRSDDTHVNRTETLESFGGPSLISLSVVESDT